MRERMAYQLPESVGPVLGALVEPMAVAYRAAQVVIDAAGVAASFEAGLAVAGTGARVVTVAAYMGPITYSPTDVMMREIEIVSSFSYNGEFDAVIGHMAAGRDAADGWVERVSFDDHLGAYERLHRGEAIKLMVDL